MSARLIARLPLPLALLLLLGGASVASAAPNAEALARYKQERAACTQGQTQQSRHDCLREADAAYAEVKRGTLDASGPADARNSLVRCDVHTGDERLACLARMQGQGSTSGSAASGGILRESTVRRVGDEPPVVVEPKR
jgi:hypothetical protein